VRAFGLADTLVMAYPNAGLPNELGEYDEAAAETAAQVSANGPRRAGQHRRRLLRDDAGAYRRDREGGAAAAAAAPRFRARVHDGGARQTLLAGLEPMVIAA
jgi:5-methyltetrahydrofolate--homocysteine methyltransferase